MPTQSPLDLGGPSDRDRFRGCLLGGAVGDALGAPVEFLSHSEIVRQHGGGGPSGLGRAYGVEGAVTDDTQMTLWTAEGLLRGLHRWETRGIASRAGMVHAAYLRWLATQEGRAPGTGTPVGAALREPGWLWGHDALHARRAPGMTCLSALQSGQLGTTDAPLNTSKGCGGVMRAAPAGLLFEPETAFEAGCEAAAVTHGHPTGWVAAGALALAVAHLRDGADLGDALDAAEVRARAARGGAETADALAHAARLAASDAPDADAVQALAVVAPGGGPGWVAEEALAVAALCARRHGGDAEWALRAAVTHSGDSDSTGAICGHLLGAAWGVGALPVRWVGGRRVSRRRPPGRQRPPRRPGRRRRLAGPLPARLSADGGRAGAGSLPRADDPAPMALPDHLATLRRRLRTGAELSPSDVVRLLGVSERQARRVVRDLDAAGPPLAVRADGKRKWYAYAPEDLVLLAEPEPLTEDEAFAVYLAAAAARASLAGTPLAAALDAAVEKLVPPDGSVFTFEPEAGGFASVGPGTQAVDRAAFAALRRAVRDGRSVTMTYTNAQGRRREDYRCEPYGVVVADGSWQLVGRDLYLGRVVRYALPAVEAVAVGDPFDRPDGFDLEAYVRESLGGFGGGEVEEVRLAVSPGAASSFRRKAYHPTQLVEEARADGGLVVSFEVAVTPDLTAFVRSFGPAVRVQAPAALAEAVAESAQATAALYGP